MADGKKQQALKRLDHLRDGLLHVQATVGGYLREIKEVRDMIDPPPTEKGGTTDGDDVPE